MMLGKGRRERQGIAVPGSGQRRRAPWPRTPVGTAQRRLIGTIVGDRLHVNPQAAQLPGIHAPMHRWCCIMEE